MRDKLTRLNTELAEIDTEMNSRKKLGKIRTMSMPGLQRRKTEIEREIEREEGNVYVWIPVKHFKLLVAEAERRFYNVPPASRVSGYKRALDRGKEVLSRLGVKIRRPAAEISRDAKRN